MAAENFLTISDEELLRRYSEALNDQVPALPMFQAEIARRNGEKSASALTKLTVVIGALTALLLAAGVIQTEVVLGDPGFPKSTGTAPDFKLHGDPAYYCSTQSPSFAGPCTASEIFINNGGLGTEVATFSVTGQTCRTVIPSTPNGNETMASCVFAMYVAAGTKPQVDVSP